MLKFKNMLELDLTLFDDGVATDTNGDGFDSSDSTDDGAQSGEEVIENDNEVEEETFDDLIKSDKYREEYGKRVEKAVKSRLKSAHKQMNEMQGKIDNAQSVMDILAARYNVKSDDYNAITNALNDDDAMVEEQAMALGMDISTYREYNKLKIANEKLQRNIDERDRQRLVNEKYQELINDASEVKTIYPEMDLETELANEQFCQLLENNVPMRTAYEVVHHDEMVGKQSAVIAKKAEQKVAKSVMANKARPKENGISSNTGTITEKNIEAMSAKEIFDIAERVKRGEKIIL